ncbi:MAG TPA: flagellar protein FlbD [Candidatus Hydrogenedentes bacterium]|nr:flagellar protein FlbD [Candidatus Hydrogenedentota bacterium]
MIRLTRLNGSEFVLNAELIREVEATPDTILTLVSGERLLVRDGVDDVVAAVLEYRRTVYQGMPNQGGNDA